MNTNYRSLRSVLSSLLCLWLVTLPLSSISVAADVLYVTDMLQLDLYATADMSGASLRRLKSGDRLEVLDTSGRGTRVRIEGGQTGWVKSLYLTEKEPARTRVNALESLNAELEKSLQESRDQLQKQQQRLAELNAARSDEDNAQSAAAAELERLRIENADMRASLATYAGSVPLSWLLACLLLVLVGGVGLGWYWFDSRSRARHGGYRIH